MVNESTLPCYRLDGTTGSQCENLRHGFKVPKPNFAQEAVGDRQTRQGIKHGKKFLFCKPGLACRLGQISVEEMIKQQSACDRFMERP